ALVNSIMNSRRLMGLYDPRFADQALSSGAHRLYSPRLPLRTSGSVIRLRHRRCCRTTELTMISQVEHAVGPTLCPHLVRQFSPGRPPPRPGPLFSAQFINNPRRLAWRPSGLEAASLAYDTTCRAMPIANGCIAALSFNRVISVLYISCNKDR